MRPLGQHFHLRHFVWRGVIWRGRRERTDATDNSDGFKADACAKRFEVLDDLECELPAAVTSGLIEEPTSLGK
jgi:hypothetical protein